MVAVPNSLVKDAMLTPRPAQVKSVDMVQSSLHGQRSIGSLTLYPQTDEMQQQAIEIGTRPFDQGAMEKGACV